MTVVPGQPKTAGVGEVPDPAADEGDVLVEGLFVGICGTDGEVVNGGYGKVPPGADRLVLGHESLGRVIDAPPGSDLAAGDLVVGVVRRPDPEPCPCCARDEWDFCRNGRYTERGINRLNGYGAQRWRVPRKFAVRVAGELGERGVLLEPTSVVAKAWEQTERIRQRCCSPGNRALVTGAGPIGLLAAMLGVQRGYEVHVLDQVTRGPKPKLVADLGATYHHSGPESLGFAPDVVVECTGAGPLVFDVAERVAPGAVICLTGLSSGRRSVSTDLGQINNDLVLDNTVVFGSVNAALRHYDQAAEALARADATWLDGLITHRVPLDSWPELVTGGKRDDTVKAVVDLQG